MSTFSAGEATVQIIPDMSDFSSRLRGELGAITVDHSVNIVPDMADFAARLQAALAAINPSVNVPINPRVTPGQGVPAGQQYADEFSRVVKTRIEAALRSLPTVQVGVATTEAEQKLRDLNARLQTLQNQTIGVDISGAEALAEIDKIKSDLASLARATPDVKVRVDALAAIAQLKAVRGEITRLEAKPAEVRVVAKDEFSTILRTKVEAAAASLPEIQVGVATTAAEQKLRDLHVRLDELRDKQVGVDIDAKDALAEVERIRKELDQLAQKSPDIQVRVDAGRAVAELAAVKAEVDNLDRQHPNVKVDASAASAGVSALVAGIATIGPALIPIGAAAVAGLGGIATLAVAGAGALGVLYLGLSDVIGAVGDVSAANKKSGAAAEASAKAQESAANAVKGAQESLAGAISSADNSLINSAQAVKSARTSLANAITSADDAEITSARAVSNARTGLASAIRAADNAAITSAQAVKSARTALADAITSADNAAVKSAQAVRNAQQGVADAVRSASSSVATALQGQRSAEQALTQAQRQQQQAQESLTAARKTAKQQIEDLDQAIADNSLAIRGSVLSIRRAKVDLDKTLSDPTATKMQRDEAQLTYDEALQQALNLSGQYVRLRDQKAESDRAGVEGSQTVLKAQEGVATATRGVATAQDNVQKAGTAVAEAQRAGAESVGKAQQSLTDAIRAQGVQSKTSADSVAKAQDALANSLRAQGVQAAASVDSVAKAQDGLANSVRAQGIQAKTSAESVAKAQDALANSLRAQDQQAKASAASIASAQRALVQAQEAAADAANTTDAASRKAAASLAALTPAGREFVDFIVSTFKPALVGLKDTAQNGLLPGLEDGLKGLLPVMPVINEAVGKLAKVMGDLFAAAGKALNSPFYREFITFIGNEGSKTIKTFGEIIGNLATGFAGLLMAFAPLTDQMGAGLLGLSQRFADFGKNTGASSGFQSFMAYVREVGPLVVRTFVDLGRVIGNLVVGLAPFGVVLLEMIDKVAQFAAALGPTGLIAVLAAAGVAFAVFTGGVGAIAIAVAGVVALFAQLYNSNKGFADLINNVVMPVLKEFGSNVLAGLKSAFNQIVDAVRPNLPQFEFLGKLIGGLILVTIKFLGLGLELAFKALGFVIASFVDVVGQLVKAFQFLALEGAQVLAALSKVPGFGWAKDGALALADLGTGYTRAGSAGDQATKSAEDTKKAQDNLTAASKKLNDEVQKSIDKFTILREGGLSVARSADALAESQAALTKSVNDNGTSLDSNTVAGRANRKAVNDVASSLNDKVNADFKATQATQGTDAALQQASATTETNRQTLIKNFEQTGLSRQAAEDYTAKLLLTPAEIATRFHTPALNTAQTDLDKFQATMDALHDKTINIKVLAGYDALASTGLSTGASTYGKADGGIMDYYANGGLREDHVAQIAPAGAMRVWAEPETGGESYIPLAPSKRERSLSIWQETGKRLNAFADGGLIDRNRNVLNSGSQPNAGAPVDHTVTVNVQPDFAAMQSGLTGFIKDIGPHLASVFAPPEVAGGVTWPAMFSIIKAQFPWALDNSDVRPGDPGYHGKGEALDVGAPGNNPAQLLEADRWIGANYPGSAELIHLGGVNIKDGRDVGDGFGLYGASTMYQHDNHVHWASAVDPSAERTPGPHFGVPAGSRTYTGPIPGGDAVGRWRGLVDSTLGELGLNVGLDDEVLRQIATESGGDPNATQGDIGDVNNASGDLARGLMQVIGTTFRANAGPYLSLGQYDPHASIYAGLNYARGRYGPDLSWLGQGQGYADGGINAHDNGGLVPPGYTTIYNGTGTNEVMLNPKQVDWVQDGMARGGGGPQVVQHIYPQANQSEAQIAADLERRLLFVMR